MKEQSKMKKVAAQILQTNDYGMFLKDIHNRDLPSNPKLKASMQLYGWLDAFPMLVVQEGDHYIIKDGQTRMSIALELGIPVKYVVTDESNVEASRVSVGKPWSLLDYVTCYAGQGKSSYVRLVEFKSSSGFSLSTCAHLLAGTVSFTQAENRLITSGKFKINSSGEWLSEAVLVLTRSISKHVKWHSNSFFIAGLCHAILYAKVDPNKLLAKLQTHIGKLTLQPTVTDFVVMIDDIYNYHTPKKDTIEVAHLVKLGTDNMRSTKGRANV